MRFFERLRERRHPDDGPGEKQGLGCWVIVQIVWLVWQIIALMRGGNHDNHNDNLKGDE